MRYIELFAGVGGFRNGIERAFDMRPAGQDEEGHQVVKDSLNTEGEHPRQRADCVFANEWDKYAAQTYNKNFGGQIDTRDITTIPTADIPDHDLLVGGFPCQAFSVAGKRRGFDEARGTLFFEIARILADKKPQHLLLENVKGLLSHDSGRTFQTILGVLADLGYRVEWQVLNSKDFGVPQNRERVIIVGHLGACCGRQVFPIARGHRAAVKEIIGGSQDGRVYDSSGDSPTLTTSSTGGNKVPKFIDLSTQEAKVTEEARTLQARYHKGFSHRKGETSGVLDGARIRRLTPIECERLQGFPDNWTAGVSDTQRYKQMGNAVTTNVIEAVVRKLYGN